MANTEALLPTVTSEPTSSGAKRRVREVCGLTLFGAIVTYCVAYPVAVAVAGTPYVVVVVFWVAVATLILLTGLAGGCSDACCRRWNECVTVMCGNILTCWRLQDDSC